MTVLIFNGFVIGLSYDTLDVCKYINILRYSNLKAIPTKKHVQDFVMVSFFFFFFDMHSNEVLWWFQTRLRNVQCGLCVLFCVSCIDFCLRLFSIAV